MDKILKTKLQMEKRPIFERPVMRKINAWYDLYKDPIVTAIDGNKDYYTGLYIKPWYGLQKKNPPLAVFLGMLDAFSRMYDEWDKAFEHYAQPYDLQLWIYDVHMMDSQLVCAGVEKAGDRRTNYFNDCPEQYTFQSGKYFNCGHFNSNDFEWTTYEVRDYLFKKTDELSPRDIRKLVKTGWHEETAFPDSKNEEQSFWRIYDFVWVGRKKLRVES